MIVRFYYSFIIFNFFYSIREMTTKEKLLVLQAVLPNFYESWVEDKRYDSVEGKVAVGNGKAKFYAAGSLWKIPLGEFNKGIRDGTRMTGKCYLKGGAAQKGENRFFLNVH